MEGPLVKTPGGVALEGRNHRRDAGVYEVRLASSADSAEILGSMLVFRRFGQGRPEQGPGRPSHHPDRPLA